MKKREVWGLRLELVGLCIILFATGWQVGVTDWWDQQLIEWQSRIQEEVNLAILLSLQQLGSLIAEDDKKEEKEKALRVYKLTSQAYQKAISMRDRRRETMANGQANDFQNVRAILLVMGAGFLTIGKWLTLSAVQAEAPSKVE